MAKSVHNDVLDGALNIIKNNCTRQVLCSAEPTTYTEANATYALADVTMASGDFALADGTTGRKITVAQKTGVLIDNIGTGTHIALLDVANSKLLFVTTCTSQAVVANGSNTMTFNSWSDTIADPA